MTTLDDGRHRMYVDVKPLPKLSERSYSTTDILRGVVARRVITIITTTTTIIITIIITTPRQLYQHIQSRCHATFHIRTTSTSGTAKAVWLSHVSLYRQSQALTLTPCHYNEHTCMVANNVPWIHVGGMFGFGCNDGGRMFEVPSFTS
jgi:hypothetical protein